MPGPNFCPDRQNERTKRAIVSSNNAREGVHAWTDGRTDGRTDGKGTVVVVGGGGGGGEAMESITDVYTFVV